jgi:hypothetical protein
MEFLIMTGYFCVSLFYNKWDNSAKEESHTWDSLIEIFRKPDIRSIKDDGYLINGTTFNDGLNKEHVFVKKLRSKSSSIQASLLILDFDKSEKIDLSIWLNMQLTFACYTTFSHATVDKPCAYRVVIPLLSPIPADKYPFLYQWASDVTNDLIDLRCKDISHMHYLPACPAEREQFFEFHSNEGALLDWKPLIIPYENANQLEVLKDSSGNGRDYSPFVNTAINNEICNVCNSVNGSRNDTLNKASFALGQLVSPTWAHVDEHEIENLLLEAAQNCGLSENEARSTIKSGLDSGKLKPRERPSDTNPNNFPSEIKSNFSLEKFDLTSKLDDLKIRATKEQYILKDIALVGQITAIYAPPNTGKTLIVLHLIIEQIKGGLESNNIFYINADDSYNGLIMKTAMAKEFGFKMLASNEEDFNIKEFFNYLKTSINDNSCNEIIIVDTLKKFANLMDKKSSSDFMKLARAYVQKGGTMILLAHTNKNKDADGKYKYGGTSDVVDDCDCAYQVCQFSQNETVKTIIFENIKRRGSNKTEVAFEYLKDFENYTQLMKSVKCVTASADTEKDKYLTDAIKKVIIQGFTNKTALISTAKKFPECSKSKIEYALDKYEGVYWKSTLGNKNAQTYQLIKS